MEETNYILYTVVTVTKSFFVYVAVAGGIMFQGCPSAHLYERLSHSCERDFLGTPCWNFFNFGTDVHLDSMMS